MNTLRSLPHIMLGTPFNGPASNFFGRDIAQLLGSDDLHLHAPKVNITESKDAFRLELQAPGYNKEELNIAVEDGMLTISAEHTEAKRDESERYTRREFGRRAFKRAFRLPENANGDGITAEFTNGILKVSIPKVEPAKPTAQRIAIA